jgi:hypothetical protein
VKHLMGPIALSAAVMILVVACGGGASAPSSVSTTTAAPPASADTTSAPAASSAADTASPSDSAASASPASQSSLAAIFSEHDDPGLEAQLPAVVSGAAMQRYSLTLAKILDAGGDRAAIDGFLQRIGKTEADGTFAAAFDPTNSVTGGIFAFKVSGADAATLLAGIVAVEQSDLGGGAAQPATVGGKSVTVVSVGNGVNDTEWVFGRGDDVVFVVHADNEAHAAAYLEALP